MLNALLIMPMTYILSFHVLIHYQLVICKMEGIELFWNTSEHYHNIFFSNSGLYFLRIGYFEVWGWCTTETRSLFPLSLQ
jgi:hypothetical protein